MPTPTLKDPTLLTREALNRLSTIATLPEVTSRIITMVEDPRTSAAELHKIVSHDPSLVARVLKVVNSAFYGLPGQIASIERAIVLLGLNAVKNIAVAASLGQLFRGVRLCEGYTAKDLWRHCVAVGVGSRELARQLKLPLTDEAFLAGMIHDIGVLVSLQVWPEQLQAACEQVRVTGSSFIASETDIVGVDHQKLGAALCEKWQFPLTCRLVAGHHHDPRQLGDAARQLVAIVYAVDTLVCRMEQGFPLTARAQSIEPAVLDTLGLDKSAVDRTAAALPELIRNASSLM